MTTPEYFLAGIGLGAALLALGYALLWVAVIASFVVGEVVDWARREKAARP